MRRCVARIPGWDKPCSESDTVRLYWRGTRGRCVPVEVLQRRGMSVVGSGIASTTKEMKEKIAMLESAYLSLVLEPWLHRRLS